MNTGTFCVIPPVISKRFILPSALAVATLVSPPLTSKSTVPDLSPLPVTIAIPDTDPVSLTVTFLSGVCATVDSAPVPEISNSTVSYYQRKYVDSF